MVSSYQEYSFIQAKMIIILFSSEERKAIGDIFLPDPMNWVHYLLTKEELVVSRISIEKL